MTPVLTNYYPRSHLTVSADASSYRLGAVLLQETGGHRLPVAYASRSLSDIETRYAQIALDLKMEKWQQAMHPHGNWTARSNALFILLFLHVICSACKNGACKEKKKQKILPTSKQKKNLT